jgi:trehalose 6-phosphate synthase/phosphatase
MAPLPRIHMKRGEDDYRGLSVSPKDRKHLGSLIEKHHGGKVVPVWLVDQIESHSDSYILKDQRRWSRFSEQEIYNVFHYKQNEPSDGRESKKSWVDYCKINKIFADRIEELYKPGDIILIHDYQLLLLPSLLRQRIPKISIGFFLHIPFPSSELYRCLTTRKELLEGVLGSNMIGFQSYGYSRHFSSCCTRILGFESSSVGVDAYGAHVAVDVFPMGINVQSILHSAFEDPAVEEKVFGIRKLYAGKKIIVGRDRMDAFRGVSQKLQAFETFLESHKEWRGKVILIQFTYRSGRSHNQETDDNKYANTVTDLVERINRTYGSSDYTPVRHFPKYLPKEEYLAFLRAADLELNTSVRDGMDINSLEYVICQRDTHNPLILSEFSGTAGSLSDATSINPWDLISISEAINKALTLSEAEKTQQHEKLYSYVIKNDIQAWTDKFLNRLLTNISSYDQSFATPVLDRNLLLKQYRRAKTRLFMFDYDGTLTPLLPDPQARIPSDKVLRTLKTLASHPGNDVWVISGRDQEFLDEWMGHITELGLSAEHGNFMRWPGSDEWDNVAEGMDMVWRDEVLRIFTRYMERTQGSFVETKKIAVKWHYRRADPEYGAYQAHECQRELEEKVAKRWDVEVMAGKANLEVRPRFVNKGEIAKKLIDKYGEMGELEFVLCLGDDYTDEGAYLFHSFASLS